MDTDVDLVAAAAAEAAAAAAGANAGTATAAAAAVAVPEVVSEQEQEQWAKTDNIIMHVLKRSVALPAACAAVCKYDVELSPALFATEQIPACHGSSMLSSFSQLLLRPA